MVPLLGAGTVYPPLAERMVLQRGPERRLALLQDLFAVCDKQQPLSVQVVAQSAIVDGRHHGLAGTGCRHDQVAMVANRPLGHHSFQQHVLERIRVQLDEAWLEDVLVL